MPDGLLERQRQAFLEGGQFEERAEEAADAAELLRQINLLASQLGISPEAAEAFILASTAGAPAAVLNRLLGTGSGAAGDGAGIALGYAQLAETQRQNAYDRVADRLRLLQSTDQLLDARRENALAALLQAAPLMVAPGTEFTPGFEPGGPAMQLSNLIGANLYLSGAYLGDNIRPEWLPKEYTIKNGACNIHKSGN